MNLISNSNYISTDALYSENTMVHSFSWGNHRYVRREGSPGKWRYIYPEDLKKAGQRLVSGVRNAVANTRDTARQIYTNAGFPQRKAYRRALDTWEKALTTSRVTTSDPIKSPKLGNKNDPRRSRALARAGVIERKAQRTVGEAYAQYAGTIADAIDDAGYNIRNIAEDAVSFFKSSMSNIKKHNAKSLDDISNEVTYFLKSKVGIGYKDRIDRAFGEAYSKRTNYETIKHNYYAANANGNSYPTYDDYMSAKNDYDYAYTLYRNTVEGYGKTFLGSLHRLMNTPYSRLVI